MGGADRQTEVGPWEMFAERYLEPGIWTRLFEAFSPGLRKWLLS